MNYTKILCLSIAMIGSAPAWAQVGNNNTGSSVQIYGILDQAIEHVNGVSTGNGQSGSSWRMGFGEYASRFGFRGSEDLGDGLKAVFALEAGVTLDTGAQGQGRLFGRQAWVGLAGDWGTLTFGRQYALRYYALFDADVYGAGSQGLGAIDAGIPNARVDNAIAYRFNTHGFSGGVNYSLGRDTVSGNNPTATNCAGESATDAQQCREWSAMLKYEMEYGGGKTGVVTAYERQNGGTKDTYAGLTSTDKNDNRFTLNAYYQKELLRVGIGWLKRTNDGSATPRSDLYWVSGAVPTSQFSYIDGMIAQIDFKDSPDGARLYTLRGNYLLSKRTVVYLGGAFINNSGTLALAATSTPTATGPLPGGSQSSINLGIRHSF
jgi:predicted porin